MTNLLNEWGLIIASISYQLWFLSPPQWDCLLKWLQMTPSFALQQYFLGPQFSWWFGTLNTFDYFLYHNTVPPALSLYFYFFSVSYSYSYSYYFLPFVEDLRIWWFSLAFLWSLYISFKDFIHSYLQLSLLRKQRRQSHKSPMEFICWIFTWMFECM